MPQRNILVTSALPYANGSIHIGHLLEYIQTDIWVRALRMSGHNCHYVCADDAHGTAVMISAERAGVSTQQWIDSMRTEHERDLRAFGVDFDIYSSTHTESTRQFSEAIYHQLDQRGYISTHSVEQLYDPEKGIFLADRYVKGVCPKCSSPDQYGDNCEVCGATYNATELLQPYSTLSGATPVLRSSEHYFFRLPDFSAYLQDWLQNPQLQPEVRNKLQEWFAAGLQQWDISRDPPYFGFRIPGSQDKYFYVWLDAPIGYPGAFAEYCQQRDDIDFDSYWRSEASSQSELYHFIGKDIIYFHGLFWPALLHGAGWRVPTAIFAHGFLTVDGAKLSKSRGTAVTAQQYLQVLDPEYLRYYFACKLSNKVEDVDFSSSDFVERCNSDLVGKLVNIASRCARFLERDHDCWLAADLLADQRELVSSFSAAATEIAELYEQREYSRLTRRIMQLADRANQYIDAQQPWKLAKDPAEAHRVQAICSTGVNLFRILIGYLKPITPKLAQASEQFLQLPAQDFAALGTALYAHRIRPFQALITRIQPQKLETLLGNPSTSSQPTA